MRVLLVGALGAMLGTSVVATTPAPLEMAIEGVGSDHEAATKIIAPPPDREPKGPDVVQTDGGARQHDAEPTLAELAEDWEVDVDDWERLADCESGEWDADGDPARDSARWRYGLDADHDAIFEGGLHFHPDTWESFRDGDMPAHAGRATKRQEIEVAERVLDEQGWNAWPVCSEKLDLRE